MFLSCRKTCLLVVIMDGYTACVLRYENVGFGVKADVRWRMMVKIFTKQRTITMGVRHLLRFGCIDVDLLSFCFASDQDISRLHTWYSTHISRVPQEARGGVERHWPSVCTVCTYVPTGGLPENDHIFYSGNNKIPGGPGNLHISIVLLGYSMIVVF